MYYVVKIDERLRPKTASSTATEVAWLSRAIAWRFWDCPPASLAPNAQTREFRYDPSMVDAGARAAGRDRRVGERRRLPAPEQPGGAGQVGRAFEGVGAGQGVGPGHRDAGPGGRDAARPGAGPGRADAGAAHQHLRRRSDHPAWPPDQRRLPLQRDDPGPRRRRGPPPRPGGPAGAADLRARADPLARVARHDGPPADRGRGAGQAGAGATAHRQGQPRPRREPGP